MALAIRGRLVSSAYATDVLSTEPWFSPPPDAVVTRMERYAQCVGDALGPAAGARQVADVAVLPLLEVLQLEATAKEDEPALCIVHTSAGRRPGPVLLAIAWTGSLEHSWRAAVHRAIANDTRWCISCNGRSLRIVDARRTWSRDFVEIDLCSALSDTRGQALVWTLLRRDAWTAPVDALDMAISRSARHGVDVCEALGRGVLAALTRLLTAIESPRNLGRQILFEHCLTVLYRILFLLFAEARGLLPLWHPVYRDRYSLEVIVTRILGGTPCRGLWNAIQAISRLAHAGCTAGELNVTAFNGRLFSPVHTVAFDRRPIADAVMRDAIVAVSATKRSSTHPRARIAYRDLDVEQLGAVYERILDYQPAASSSAGLVRTREVRKASGAFYTPRALTAHLVRHTLTPLTAGRTSDEILALRILDPAMGSGAFLVAACRFLAAAAEEALIAEGQWHAGDVTAEDRALLRRDIATRCLYGVDVNPMAVQLARLSLWLATLATDRPLSFLDHHLVAGNSLLGASPADVQRQPSRMSTRAGRRPSLPLFETNGLQESLVEATAVRMRLAVEPDATAAAVRDKERALAALERSPTLVNRWRRVLDLWCAGWFWPDGSPPDRGTFGELARQILDGRSTLHERVSLPFLERARAVANEQEFLHWSLSFPEVFATGGFDAVIGNPPWDMVRGDAGTGDARERRQRQARDATTFLRQSGVFVVGSRAHTNCYQLFVERALQLLRPGGRLGLVLPGGVATDAGSAALRRHLFDRADVDSITGLDNRGGIFPIHRGVRFALVTATSGRPTWRLACRFGLQRVEQLDAPSSAPLHLTRHLLEQISGADDLGIPELLSERDLRIVERIATSVPRLGDANGWGVHFGRELNATDDRAAFVARGGHCEARPIVEGKQIAPFHVDVAASELELRQGARAGTRVPRRARLVYREVASATNRLTLIAAVAPAHVVTTHTVFCLKPALPQGHQQVLCALLNSFVANYLIRLRVNTHVTASLMSRLPVPPVASADPRFNRLQVLAQRLASLREVEQAPEYAELQAVVARLYGLSIDDFEHVLTTFPLVSQAARDAACRQLRVLACEPCL